MDSTNTIEQTISSTTKPKKPWTLVVAWIIFIVTTILFLAIGPGSIIVAFITNPYSWVVTYFWIPSLYEILKIVAPIILILAGVCIFFTYKKFPTRIKKVLILFLNVLTGLPFTWLSVKGIIPMRLIFYAIIMGIIALTPIILLIVLRMQNKKKTINPGSTEPSNEGSVRSIVTISFVIIAVELVFSITQIVAPI